MTVELSCPISRAQGAGSKPSHTAWWVCGLNAFIALGLSLLVEWGSLTSLCLWSRNALLSCNSTYNVLMVCRWICRFLASFPAALLLCTSLGTRTHTGTVWENDIFFRGQRYIVLCVTPTAPPCAAPVPGVCKADIGQATSPFWVLASICNKNFPPQILFSSFNSFRPLSFSIN